MHANIVWREHYLLEILVDMSLRLGLLQDALLKLDRSSQLNDLLLIVDGYLLQLFLIFHPDLVEYKQLIH